MKIIKSEVADFLPEARIFTILFLDDEFPKTKWNKVRIGNSEFLPLHMSMAPMEKMDKIAIRGAHQFDGQTIEFI